MQWHSMNGQHSTCGITSWLPVAAHNHCITTPCLRGSSYCTVMTGKKKRQGELQYNTCETQPAATSTNCHLSKILYLKSFFTLKDLWRKKNQNANMKYYIEIYLHLINRKTASYFHKICLYKPAVNKKKSLKILYWDYQKAWYISPYIKWHYLTFI